MRVLRSAKYQGSFLTSVLLLAACSASESGGGGLERTRTEPGVGDPGNPDGTGMLLEPPTTDTSGGGTFGPLDDPSQDGTINIDDACVIASAEPTIMRQPVDIILVLDNSGSMADELQAVEDNINRNFASILEASDVDYRVILISRHREDPRAPSGESSTSICVSAPLSGLGACPTDAAPLPAAMPILGERFFHYSVKIESTDSFERILGAYGLPDEEYGLTNLGFSEWLRPGAKKVFLEMTDDNAVFPLEAFLVSLTALAPDFGTPTNPTFVWHSITGIAEKNPPTEAYLPGEPLQVAECTGNANTVENAGESYQTLSIMTGGLRFPLCQFTGFDVVFQRIATDVVVTSNLACDFDIPAPPLGETLDLSKVAVSVTPGSGDAEVQFGQAATVADCQANAFFIDGATNRINLCPDACTAVRSDPLANVDVLFTCESTIILR